VLQRARLTRIGREQQLFTLLPDGGRSAPLAIAYTAEQQSLSALRTLLTQSVEAIAFILLLISYDLSSIIASCAPAPQSTLLSMSYQDLLGSKNGRNVARTLVSAVINQHIERQLSVGPLTLPLEKRY
jgi:nuclear pore complex protein Nup155